MTTNKSQDPLFDGLISDPPFYACEIVEDGYFWLSRIDDGRTTNFHFAKKFKSDADAHAYFEKKFVNSGRLFWIVPANRARFVQASITKPLGESS